MYKRAISVLGCLLCAFSLSVGDEVPTMAISCGNTPLAALPKVQQSMGTLEFKKLLSYLWNDDTKVVMVFEDELSLEDFALKDTEGHSLFQTFENAKERRFFPLVDQPEKAVDMLSKNGFSVKIYNEDTYKNNSGKIIALADFIENKNENDNRQSILLRHQNDVSKIFSNLCEQYKNVVLILSGKLNPWIEKSKVSSANRLVTRHLMGVDNPEFILEKGSALIYSGSYPTLSTKKGEEILLQYSDIPSVIDNSRDSLLKIVKFFKAGDAKIILRFRFEKLSFTWELKSIEYEKENFNESSSALLTPRKPISAQIGLSYFSEGPIVFSNNSIVLTFKDKFQAEAWLRMKTRRTLKFNDPQEQDAFFTPPILAGLFVTFLLLFIVTWGITMIMDIKTMDRFDDPKGKTISISAVE